MVSSQASTVLEYLEALTPEQRNVISALRDLILAHLPAGYQESMNWGMICYEIPLERYPDTYNDRPLAYVALAAQKNNYSLHLMGCYGSRELEARLRAAFKDAGLRLDMGKSCVRFKGLADLPLEAIGEIVAAVPVDEYIRRYERVKKKAK